MSSVVYVAERIVDVDCELKDKWDWMLCEVASGGVWQRLIKFGGFSHSLTFFGGWSVNG